MKHCNLSAIPQRAHEDRPPYGSRKRTTFKTTLAICVLVCSLISFLLLTLPLAAKATPTSDPTTSSATEDENETEEATTKPTIPTNTYLTRMGVQAFNLYLVVRNFSVLFVILSLANYGFLILGAAMMGRGDLELDKIKKQILYMVLSLIGICILPSLLGWAKDMTMPGAWSPP